ncbi:COG4223 family protein [Tropicimonas sp. IMCC34011]|uniref:COG4223 family protein n=1 Tax=Tropicimonas sp. IMCC34011 TaxID=2248759 RepID=UPI000E28760D|nr:mitofilin family membrane protein [Tropicimonas sp. IMCC34011]
MTDQTTRSDEAAGLHGAARRTHGVGYTAADKPADAATPVAEGSVPSAGTRAASKPAAKPAPAKPAAAETPAAQDTPPTKSKDRTPSDASASRGGTQAPPPSTPARSGGGSGFLGGLIGGILAAALVVLLAPFILPATWTGADDGTALDGVSSEIETVRTDLDGASARIEEQSGQIGALTERLDSQTADQQGALSALNDQLADLSERVDALERRPVDSSDDEEIEAALSAYRAEVARLREDVAAQSQEMQRQLEEASANAEAASRAEAAAGRAALLSQIRDTLDTGAPYDDLLSELDTTPPEALAAAAPEGVATLAELQDRFPEHARSALAASANAGDIGEGNALTRFARSQLGARSIAPREGDDPDAILSRAEAALRSGDLEEAVTEVQSLSEVPAEEMQPWTDAATERADAIAALEDMSSAETEN